MIESEPQTDQTIDLKEEIKKNLPVIDENHTKIEKSVKNENGDKAIEKPKWKLKIRVSSKSDGCTDSSDKEWEVSSGNENTKEMEGRKISSELESLLKSPTNSRNSMIDALTPTELPAKRKIKRKSFEVVTYTSPANKKTKGGLRSDCPPFCKSNCTFSHHPLLVCARKMIENDSATTMMFLDAVSSYYGGDNGNMNPEDSIFDPWKNTELPLLHYIALMGKCAGCFAMIDAGHTPKVVIYNSDTVLHTLIKDMYLFNCTHGHMDILLKKFCLLLKEFKDCLLLTDNSGRNPLHLCSKLIYQNSELLKSSSKQPFRLYQFQKNMLSAMLEQCKIEGFDSSYFNNTDSDGNTFSHYIAKDRASFNILDDVKNLGADFNIRNNSGKTINEIMEQAAPLPPPKLLEMAAYSAKGKKYKAANKKPVIPISTSTNKRLSPRKQVKPSPKKKKSEDTPVKPLLKSEKKHAEPFLKTKEVQPNLSVKPNKLSKVRVKITPTRKEKLELKLNKQKTTQNDMSAKENVADTSNSVDKNNVVKSDAVITIGNYLQTAPISIVSPNSVAKNKPILPKPVLMAISSTNTSLVSTTSILTKSTLSTTAPVTSLKIQDATRKSDPVKIVLPSVSTSQPSPLSIVAKVKPITSSEVSQLTQEDYQKEVMPKLGNIGDKPVKSTNPIVLTPVSAVFSTPMNTLQVNNITRTDLADPRKYLPMYMNSNSNTLTTPQNTFTQLPQAVPLDKPMFMKTGDGTYVQLSVSNQGNTNIPNHAILKQPRQNMQRLPVNFPSNSTLRMVLSQRPNAPQMIPPPRTMTHPPRPINFNGQWVYPMTNGEAATLFPIRFPTKQQISMQRQIPPQQMLQQQMQQQPMLSPPPSMVLNNASHGMPPMNTFFPPHSQVYHQPPTVVPLRPPPMPPATPMPLPTKFPQVNIKRAQNLEANIRNLKAVSMDIISTQSTKVSPNQNTKSPNQQIKPPTPMILPTEEPVPPVYIIDADDEQVIFRDDSPKKKDQEFNLQNDEHKPKETNDDVHKESISERKCKYQVELQSNSCQHFEKFLVANRLRYTKIECCEHDPLYGEDENRFLVKPPKDRKQMAVDANFLARELSDWFLHTTSLCRKHFASYIINREEEQIDRMLTSDYGSCEELSEEETKDWVKVEHFLSNEHLRGIIICSCLKTGSEDSQHAALFEHGRVMSRDHNLISQQEVHKIADELRRWLQRNPWVSQGYFAIHYLNRSQGTISNLLRWATAPTSKQGEEVWIRIKHFLEDEQLQESFALAARDKHRAQQSPGPKSGTASNSQQEARLSTHSSAHSSNFHHRYNPPHHQHYHPLENQETTEPKYEDEPNTDPCVISIPLPQDTFTQEDIHVLADRLTDWLQRYPFVSQVRFSKTVLQRTQSTLSSLLKMRCLPISSAGQEVWHKIRDFLNDPMKQDVFLKGYGMMKKEEKADNFDSERKRYLSNRDEADIPTQTVTPFKVQRLGEFDQATVNQLADGLKNWLECHPRVSQGFFAQTVLSRSQGTLSLLLTRKSAPISNSGEEVWRKIRDFLQDERKQDDLTRLANLQYAM